MAGCSSVWAGIMEQMWSSHLQKQTNTSCHFWAQVYRQPLNRWSFPRRDWNKDQNIFCSFPLWTPPSASFLTVQFLENSPYNEITSLLLLGWSVSEMQTVMEVFRCFIESKPFAWKCIISLAGRNRRQQSLRPRFLWNLLCADKKSPAAASLRFVLRFSEPCWGRRQRPELWTLRTDLQWV